MIATILSLNGGLLTTILCIDNQYLVTINSQIKLSVCLSVCLYSTQRIMLYTSHHTSGNHGTQRKVRKTNLMKKSGKFMKNCQSGKRSI